MISNILVHKIAQYHNNRVEIPYKCTQAKSDARYNQKILGEEYVKHKCNGCDKKWSFETVRKVAFVLSRIEIALAIVAIIIAHQLMTNSQPKFLSILQGQIGPQAILITGISLLALSALQIRGRMLSTTVALGMRALHKKVMVDCNNDYLIKKTVKDAEGNEETLEVAFKDRYTGRCLCKWTHKWNRNKTLTNASRFSLVEIALAIGLIVISSQILTNSLPSYLKFLQGNLEVAKILEITGISVLAFPALTQIIPTPSRSQLTEAVETLKITVTPPELLDSLERTY